MTTTLAANVERWCLDLPPRDRPRRPHHAYGGARATGRQENRGKRHAVSPEGHLAGLPRPDAECGRLVSVDLGPWDPDHPDNCPTCVEETQR